MRFGACLAAAVLVMACGGSGGSSGDSTASGEGTATSSGGAHLASSGEQACVSLMRRERSCEPDFVAQFVAMRVRLDLPAGIAARDASEGRDALVAEARAEYTQDATDASIHHACEELQHLPPEEAEAWTDQMEHCLAATECAPFLECDMAFHEQRLTSH